MKSLKKVGMWIISIFMLLVGIAYFPSLTSIFAIVFGIIALPVRKVQDFLTSKKIEGIVKTVILITMFVLSIATAPKKQADEIPNDSSIVDTINPTETSKTETQEETKEETHPETTVGEETVATESEPAETLSVDTLADYIEALFASAFENYTVEHDDTGITISLWQDGLAIGATLAQAGNAEMKAQWDYFVSQMEDLSKTTEEFIASSDHPELVITFNILNDQNKDNVLLMIIDGTIVYNAVP